MPDSQNPQLLNTIQFQPNVLMAVRRPPFFTPVLANSVQVAATLAQPVATEVTPMVQNRVFTLPAQQKLLVRNDLVLSRIGETKFINPFLGGALAGIVPQTNGLPREQMTVPISPRVEVTDEQLFEGAVDTAARFFLPRYRIQTEAVSGQNQIRLALEKDGDGGKLTVFFEKFPAPSIAEASRTAQELPHSVNVILRFTLGNVQKELEFQERSTTLNQAVLRVTDSAQLTQLYRALSETAYSTVLIVRRLVEVALPVDPAPVRPPVVRPFPLPGPRPFPGPGPHFPELIRMEEAIRPAGFDRLDAHLAGPEIRDHRPITLITLPDGREIRDHRGLPIIANMPPMNFPPPPPVVPPAPPAQLYRQTSRALDVELPLDLPVALFPSVYQDIVPSLTPPGPGLIPRQVTFQGRSHRYFQDTADRNTIYYLPDSFKLARKPVSAERFPFMSFEFTAPDGAPDTPGVTVRYAASPFVEGARIVDAVSKMKPFLSNPAAIPVLKPMLSSKTQLRLFLPGGGMQDQTGAKIDLQQGFADVLSLSMPDFQEIYDALFSNASVLFQGDVLVNVGFDAPESIPFSARMDDLIGDVFDYTATPDAVAGVVNVRLQNASESPVSIKTLTATLLVNTAEQPAMLTNFAPPAQIKPGEAITFGVVPLTQIPNGGITAAEPLFDLKIDTHPDPAAVLKAILNENVQAEYKKKITVQTPPSFFDPIGDQPGHQLIAIVVDFDGGTSVVLMADHIRDETVVSISLRDVILKTATDGVLHYRVTTVRKDGTGLVGEPKPFTGGTVLFLTNDDLPKND